MNYTLIGYTEDSSFIDRHGDYHRQPGDFDTFFTRDREELIKTWADWSFNRNFESLNLLLNGVPEEEFDKQEQIIGDELDEARLTRCQVLRQEKQELDKQTLIRLKAEEKRKAELQVRIQREKDLQTLTQLKKKLGIS